MKLLLDTQVLLWWLNDVPRLGPQARAVIADSRSSVLVSIASFWELSIKWGNGKIDDRGSITLEAAREAGFAVLGVEKNHLAMLEAFDRLAGHNDPFDHLILVQATAEEAILMTSDHHMRRYDIRCYRPRLDR